MDAGVTMVEGSICGIGGGIAFPDGYGAVGNLPTEDIVSFLESALCAAGLRCGVTTSPHLVSWCERIAIDGIPISEGHLRQLLLAQQELCAEHQLTPFEQLLTAALAHFHAEAVELLVLEVGLGGRLDATTAHPKRPVIAMASIGLDHCEHLGSTLTAIAAEKAAVITPGSRVISSDQPEPVRLVLEQTCRANNADLQWVDPLPSDWTLGLAGNWQRRNAAVARGALQALRPLGWNLDETTIRAGFAKARWSGRLQTVTWQGHPLLLDGAHNPASAAALACALATDPRTATRPISAVIGATQGHDLRPFAEALGAPARGWATQARAPRSVNQADVLAAVTQAGWQQIEALPLSEALAAAQEHAQTGGVVLVTGSLYLVGEVRAHLLGLVEDPLLPLF